MEKSKACRTCFTILGDSSSVSLSDSCYWNGFTCIGDVLEHFLSEMVTYTHFYPQFKHFLSQLTFALAGFRYNTESCYVQHLLAQFEKGIRS